MNLDKELIKLGFLRGGGPHDVLQKPFPFTYNDWFEGVIQEKNPKFYINDTDDEAYMKKASQNSGSIVLHYGGSRGSGKRLDIHMESSVYRFMWNLRNKQGGKYPSHIMCDYKKK